MMNQRTIILVFSILFWLILLVVTYLYTDRATFNYDKGFLLTQNGELPILINAHSKFIELIPLKEEVLVSTVKENIQRDQEQYKSRNEAIVDSTVTKLREARRIIDSNRSPNRDFDYDQIVDDINKLGDAIGEYIRLSAEKGFTDNGLIGQIRTTIRPIHLLAKDTLKDTQLHNKWYELRRREKDYIERSRDPDKEVKYATYYAAARADLIEYVDKMYTKSDVDSKENLGTKLNNIINRYDKSFEDLKEILEEYYSVEAEIDRSFLGIESKLQKRQSELLKIAGSDLVSQEGLYIILFILLAGVIPLFLLIAFLSENNWQRREKGKMEQLKSQWESTVKDRENQLKTLQEETLAKEKTYTKNLTSNQNLLSKIQRRDQIIRNIAFNILDYTSIKELINGIWPVIKNVIGEDTILAIYLVNENNEDLLDCLWGNPNVNELIFKESSRNIQKDVSKASVACLLRKDFISIPDIEADAQGYDTNEERKVFSSNRKSFLYQRLESSTGLPLGVVSFQSYQANTFNEYDEGTLKTLATYISYSIEVKDQFNTISELGLNILNQSDVNSLLRTVFNEVSKLIGNPELINLAIGVLDRDREVLRFKGIKLVNNEIVIQEGGEDELKNINEPSVLCFNESKDVKIPDISETSSLIYSIDKSLSSYKSLNYFPLFYRGQLKLGVIGLHALKKDLFSEKDFKIVKILSIFISEILFNLQKASISPDLAELAADISSDKIKRIQQLLATSGLESAFVALDEFAMEDSTYLVIRTTYHAWQEKRQMGILNHNQENTERNQITASLVSWLNSKGI